MFIAWDNKIELVGKEKKVIEVFYDNKKVPLSLSGIGIVYPMIVWCTHSIYDINQWCGVEQFGSSQGS
jgi:hypothetical protein